MNDHDKLSQALKGPLVSVRTPFDEDGSIDYVGLKRFIDFTIEGGAKAIVLTYGDSLYSVLTESEIYEITKAAVIYTAGRVPVVGADAMWPTLKNVGFARECAQMGVDILMVCTPDWACSCTPESMAEHYKVISEHIPVMVVTNVFIQRGMAFGLKTLKILKENAPGVIAVKDDFCGNFGRRLCIMAKGRWAVIMGGTKEKFLELKPYGCDAYFSTYLLFKPMIADKFKKMIGNNDIEGAADIISRFEMPFFDLINTFKGGFDAGIRGAMEIFGIIGRFRRDPYCDCTKEEINSLKELFVKQGIL